MIVSSLLPTGTLSLLRIIIIRKPLQHLKAVLPPSRRRPSRMRQSRPEKMVQFQPSPRSPRLSHLLLALAQTKVIQQVTLAQILE